MAPGETVGIIGGTGSGKSSLVNMIDLLHTRIFGNKIYVDVEIGVNGSYTLRHAHEIAEEVHEGIEKNFPKVKHVMVHVNPADVAE